jgi:hypothetical protein
VATAPASLLDFARRYTAAWCSQNPATVAAFYSPDGALRINGGAAAVGRRAIADAAQEFMTAFPDMQVLMDDLVIQDGLPHFHWTLIGTNTGPGWTGRRVRISGFEEWKIGADGLIVASLGTFDNADYQRQLAG